MAINDESSGCQDTRRYGRGVTRDMDPNEAWHGLGESFSEDGLSQQMVKEHSVAAIVGAPT